MNLDDLLAATRPADLLPPRRRAEADRVVLPWTVVADVELGGSAPGIEPRLLLLEDARGVRYGVPAAIEDGRLRRATPGDGLAEAVVATLVTGSVVGLDVESFAPVMMLMGECGIDVDQTNELVVVGQRAVVKWILHPTDDEQPAPERLAALARAGFDGTPRPWGIVRLVGSPGALVAMIVDYVPDAMDGWDWAVDDVRAHARDGVDVDSTLAPVLEVAGLVARMHVALAAAGVGIATGEDSADWHRRAVADIDAAPLTPELAARALPIVDRLARATGTPVIATHGDLHIGQILRSSAGRYYVIDFDGSPMLRPQDRLRPEPVARDVASMLASFDNVGRVVLHRTDDLDAAQQRRVLGWIESAQAAFLTEYRQSLTAAGSSDLLVESLIAPFQVQQECREYAYAERYLPHWRYVPDAALPALLDRGSA